LQENKSLFFKECFSSVSKLANNYKDHTALLKYHLANILSNNKNHNDHVKEQINIVLEKKTKEKSGFIEMLRRVEECEVIINSDKNFPSKTPVKPKSPPKDNKATKKVNYSVKRRSVSFREVESGSIERKKLA